MMELVFPEIPIELLCTKVTTGATPLRSRNDYYAEGTIDWYKTGELKDWYLGPAEERITEKALGETSVKLFPAKTVLMAMYGDGRTITSLGILRAPAATNQACSAMFVDESKCDHRYFFYSLKARRHLFLNIAYGGAQRNLTGKLIREFTLPVPGLPMQRRIADILSAYDELMENCKRRIRILEEMARALYREWFVHFRFPGHEKFPRVDSSLGPIPRGWEAVAFTEIADVLSGGTPKTDVPEYWDGNIPFFTPRDALACFYVLDTDKHTNELGLSKCASELYPPNTVFITARGTVGKVAMNVVPMAMNQSCYALRGKLGIPQRFLFLMTLRQVDYLKTNTGGATFDTIVVDTFRRMAVAKPPPDLIVRFARLTDATFEAINNLTQKVANLRRTRDLLLPRLLSGQVSLDVSFVEDVTEPTAPAPRSRSQVQLGNEDLASEEPALRAAEEAPPYRVERASPGLPPPAEPADEAPVPIDQIDRTEVLQVIRQVFSEGPPREREAAIRDVARALGYRRTGPRIQEILHTDLMTAVRRCILENDHGTLRLCARSITDYDRDFLKQQFLAAIGRTWIDRDTANRDFCRWLGFARTGPVIEETARSLINGLLREGRLESDGSSMIRRS